MKIKNIKIYAGMLVLVAATLTGCKKNQESESTIIIEEQTCDGIDISFLTDKDDVVYIFSKSTFDSKAYTNSYKLNVIDDTNYYLNSLSNYYKGDIKSITINDDLVYFLNEIDNTETVEQIIINESTLTNIDVLKRYKKLNTIVLNNCYDIKDLSATKDLKNLKTLDINNNHYGFNNMKVYK